MTTRRQLFLNILLAPFLKFLPKWKPQRYWMDGMIWIACAAGRTDFMTVAYPIFDPLGYSSISLRATRSDGVRFTVSRAVEPRYSLEASQMVMAQMLRDVNRYLDYETDRNKEFWIFDSLHAAHEMKRFV